MKSHEQNQRDVEWWAKVKLDLCLWRNSIKRSKSPQCLGPNCSTYAVEQGSAPWHPTGDPSGDPPKWIQMAKEVPGECQWNMMPQLIWAASEWENFGGHLWHDPIRKPSCKRAMDLPGKCTENGGIAQHPVRWVVPPLSSVLLGLLGLTVSSSDARY
jgi:hypothetical protein